MAAASDYELYLSPLDADWVRSAFELGSGQWQDFNRDLRAAAPGVKDLTVNTMLSASLSITGSLKAMREAAAFLIADGRFEAGSVLVALDAVAEDVQKTADAGFFAVPKSHLAWAEERPIVGAVEAVALSMIEGAADDGEELTLAEAVPQAAAHLLDDAGLISDVVQQTGMPAHRCVLTIRRLAHAPRRPTLSKPGSGPTAVEATALAAHQAGQTPAGLLLDS